MTIAFLPNIPQTPLVPVKAGQVTDAGRRSEVECIDWSCDGEKLFVLTRDGTVKMYRGLVEERSWTGSAITWLEPHPSHPNVFATVSWDGKLRITDLRGGASPQEFDLKQARGWDKFLLVTWSPDGTQLAILTRADAVHVLQVDTLGGDDFVSHQPGSEVYSVLFDRQSRLWVALGGTPGKIQILTPNGMTEMVAHAHMTTTLARAASPNLIVSGGNDALVALWDTNTLCCIRTFPESLSPVTTLACGGSGGLVAWGSGGSKDGESVLSIAVVETGVHALSHPLPAPVVRVKWHPSKRLLAYSLQGPESTVHLLSFSTGSDSLLK